MRRFHKIAAFGASTLALMTAVEVGGGAIMAHNIRQDMRTKAADSEIALDFGTVSVSPFTRSASIKNVSLRGLNGTLSIGQVTVRTQAPLAMIGMAEAAENDFTMDNITVDFGAMLKFSDSAALKLEIPTLKGTGVSVDKSGFEGLFKADKDLPTRLQGLNARSLSMPQLKLNYKIGADVASESVYKDISFDNVIAGKIDRVSIASGTSTSSIPDKSAGRKVMSKAVIGKHETRGLNLVQAAHFWYDIAKPDEKPVALYDSYTADGMTMTSDADLTLQMNMGKLQANQFRVRPMTGTSFSTALGEILTEIAKQTADQKAEPTKPGSLADAAKNKAAQGKSAPQKATPAKAAEKPTPEQLKKYLAYADAIFDTFEDDGVSYDGMRILGGDPAKPAVDVNIGKASGTFGNSNTPAGFKIENINVKAPDVTAKLGGYSVEGFSYRPMLAGLAEALAHDDPDLSNVDPRTFIPKLGSSVISGLEIDAPDPDAPKGAPAQRINVKLGEIRYAFGNQIRGVPSDLLISINNLALKLPENSPNDAFKQLKALGYGNVDLSAKIAAKWEEASKQINISDVALSGANMGSVKLSGTLGNVGREVFESDMAMIQVALLGASAKNLSLKVENTGLAEKVITMTAGQQGRKPEELRAELGAGAAMMIPMVLGNSDDVKSLTAAVSRFLAKPKGLQIDVTAKSANGIGVPDIVTINDPQKALTLVNIKATATD